METPHNFQRSSENDRNICFFCDNVWPTLNNVVTSFQTCSICGGSIHSNCKHLAGYCLLCESPQRYNPPERSIVYGGQLNISVRHVYDITITEGATVYGKLILSEATTKTKFQTFISKECIWSEPDVLKVLGVKANMNVFKFELWSSGFIEFFDQIWYACEIDLRPVFWHPNSKIDRWFVFHKVSNDGIHGSVGKVLVDFEYVLPPELLHSPNHSFESINSQIPGDITTSENAKSENPGKTIEEMEVTKLDVCEISHISSNDDDEDTEEKKLISSEVEGELCAVQKLQEIVEAVEKTNSNPTKSSPSVTESSRISSFFTDSVEKTVSTLGNLLYELETTALNEKIEEKQHPLKPAQNNQPPEHSKEDEMQDETISVGKLVMKIETVFKYDVRDAAEGDHYFTVEIDNEVKFKSRIVRNSATPIFNCSVSLQIPHFRAIVDVNLYDAQSASKIGSARLTAYQIMQRKADAKYWKSLGYVDNTISIYDTSGRQEIGYYTGSFSFEEDVYHHYYSSAVRYSASSPEEDLSVERLGIHISRFTEIINFFSKCYQEYLSIMDWSDPILTSSLFLLFLYCTLQVNPDYGMSGIFFCIVLLMTRTFIRRTNGEYLRVYLAKGMKEVVPDYRPLAELKIGVLAFRLRHPKSLLSPSPISSNSSVPSSSTFGFLVPSSSSTDDQHSRPPVLKVSFSPLRETDSGNEREYLVGYLGVSDTAMTTTGASGVTQFVNSFLGSETNKQYWHITNVIDIWKSAVDRSVLDKIGGIKGCIPAGSADCCLVFRIPQPIISKLLPGEKDPIPSGNSRKSVQKGDSTTSDKIMQNEIPEPVSDGMVTPFLSWSQNRSTLTIFLQYEVGNTLSPDKEEEQIHISIKDLIHYGTPNCPDLKKATSFELVKWFKAQKKNDKGPSGTSKKKRGSGSSHNNDLLDHTELSTDSYDQDHSVYHYFSDNSQDTKNEGVRSSAPSNSNPTDSTEVLLRISFTLPDERETLSPNENEKRISQTLQTILSGRIDKESNTFTVLWNMRDHVRYVQNLMNWLLDLIESFKNIFNWTLPEKTFPIYVAFVAIWVLTVFIPGRIIILGIGLYEFLYIFLPIPDGNEISIRFANLLNSIPNDDDLVQIYSKEREKYREQKKQLQKKQLYHILLNTSLPCRWFGKVSMKWSSGSSMTVAGESEWIDAIILLQGKRILWWKDENNQQISENNEVEVPDKPPKGQVLLTAHSGITQVSPVDLRVLSAKITDVTIDKLISIFGQDPSGKPAKLTICFNSNETKRKIESVISNMVGK